MRLILQDNHTGYLFADTADIRGEVLNLVGREADCAVEAARAADIAIEGDRGRVYSYRSSNPMDTSTGYHVWRADVRGSEAVALVTDGQDQKVIEAVERDCEYLGFVTTGQAPEGPDGWNEVEA